MRRLLITFLLLFLACSPRQVPRAYLLDGEQVIAIQAEASPPRAWLEKAGLPLNDGDRLLLHGLPISPDQSISVAGEVHLQIRRAHTITLRTESGQSTFRSAAETIGEALREQGYALYAADRCLPSLSTPLERDLQVTCRFSRPITIEIGNRVLTRRTAAATVGEALAEAGMPLLGLDFSEPPAEAMLPADGHIRLHRVWETVQINQKSIPFTTEFVASADLELDQQQMLRPGEEGVSMGRVRIRYQDGEEVSRRVEAETIIRAPQNRLIGYGTKVVIRTAVVDGVTIEYWRAVRMYATSYSPCRSAPDRCYPYTASGKPVQRGVVAVILPWYQIMRGQPLYIPGYGRATIEDVGGGIPGRLWIDLGFSDADYEPWHQWVTVYFLTPVPANILYILE
ncbi:MAG: G5 domain-containing protein [Anaerolineales bacterium]